MPQLYGVVTNNRNYLYPTVAMTLGEAWMPVCFPSNAVFQSIRVVLEREHPPWRVMRIYRKHLETRDLEGKVDPFYLPQVFTAQELMKIINDSDWGNPDEQGMVSPQDDR